MQPKRRGRFRCLLTRDQAELRREDDLGKVRGHLLDADRELQRIAHITRQSLGFYRETSAASLFRPDMVIREVFDFYSFRAAQARIRLDVEIKTEQNAWGNAGEIPPGDLQPPRQQQGCLPGWRCRLRESSRGSQPAGSDSRWGTDIGDGHRLRHRPGKPGPYLRTLLHHQERHGYRLGPVGFSRVDREARRLSGRALRH